MRFPLGRLRHGALHACLATASLVAIACGPEQVGSPRPGDTPSFAVGGKKPPAKPTIADVSGPSSLVIGGSAGSYAVAISNQTSAILNNVSVQATIDQGGASRTAGNVPVECPGAFSGVLPVGGCVMTFAAAADNGAAGTGTLAPGGAKLVINLVQTTAGVATIFDSETLRISLTAPQPTAPYITDLKTKFSSFVAGVGQDYTVTLTNPTSVTQSIVTVQAIFVQNGVRYAGGGTNAQCPILDLKGELPPGDCTFTWHTSTFPPPSGPVPGQATWRLELLLSTSPGESVLLDFREVSVKIR